MHAPETDAIVSAVDAADDDVGGDRRGVGVAIAEEPGEEGAEVFAVEVFGAEDDFLAGVWGHLEGTFGWGSWIGGLLVAGEVSSLG
ncbi:hypothetical protein EMIT093MI4_140142 [Pseudomonas sp. IT-93MI4]